MGSSENVDALKTIGFFDGVSDAQREWIATHCRRRTYPAHGLIIEDGATDRRVFFLVAGRVRFALHAESGRLVSFRDIGPGEMFGEIAAIDGGPRSSAATALDAVAVLTMTRGDFLSMLERFPDINVRVLERLTQLVRVLSDRIFEFSTLAVRNRIHAELLRLAKAHRTSESVANVHPAPTHADIASRVSTHREAVSREMSDLATIGLVEKRGRNLVIRDIPRLEAMIKAPL